MNTVPLGQAEAARAIGLSFLPAARLVILPQAFRGADRAAGQHAHRAAEELDRRRRGQCLLGDVLTMKTMLEFNANYLWEIFAMFAIGYVILVIPIGVLTTWLSSRLAVKR